MARRDALFSNGAHEDANKLCLGLPSWLLMSTAAARCLSHALVSFMQSAMLQIYHTACMTRGLLYKISDVTLSVVESREENENDRNTRHHHEAK